MKLGCPSRHDCEILANLRLASVAFQALMTMLQMEPVRPAVWDIQRDPRPLQEEPRGVQARQAQHLQEAGGERGRPQVTE